MKNSIKAIALSTLLISGFAVQAQETKKESVTTEQAVAATTGQLSDTAKQVINKIENYPNTDLDVVVNGKVASINGTVSSESDKKVIANALKAVPDFSTVQVNIEVSE